MGYKKFLLCLKLTLSLAVIVSAQTQTQTQTQTRTLSPQAAELAGLPPALKESLTMYLLQGTNTAIINLKDYWLPTRDKNEFSRDIQDRIRELDEFMKNPKKVELIHERNLTDSLRSYYILIGYEQGAIFARFDMYSVDDKAWLINYAMDSNMEAVIPDLNYTIP